MCKNCSKNACTGCGEGGLANLGATVTELKDKVDQLFESLKAFTCGKPIVLVQHPEDVAMFDLTTGVGFDCWDGWALCNGTSHLWKGKNITTPNFTDRFVVQAGGNYAVNDVGGLDSVALVVAEIPSHNHALTDPGHTHAVTDPGHDHGVTDPGHNHSVANHTHSVQTDVAGAHTHDVSVDNQGTGLRSGGETNTATSGTGTYGTTLAGNHSHSGTTNAAGGGPSSNAFTGIDINQAFTGNTNVTANTNITMANTGGGKDHENRPPYYAAFFAMKL